MLRSLLIAATWCASLTVLNVGTASAQFFGGGGDCGCSAAAPAAMMVSAPVTACSSCQQVVQTVCAPPVQPVMQTVYRQVPVTEYQPVREMAKRQVFETKFVDQAVTAYRPITETKIAEVPTVSYQDMTECQTQFRNVGYWRTRYECQPKASPCQYDGRPGLVGWMNRTGYEVASAFRPDYRTTREYVPQTIAQQVPVTRRVAVQGTRQVTYNVTRMEPYQTTQRVAVTEPRWEEVEVTVMKPMTVVKTMAVGTQVTYVPAGSIGTATALRPYPDNGATATGIRPRQSADALDRSDPAKVNDKTRSSIDFNPVIRPMLQPASQPTATPVGTTRPRTMAWSGVEINPSLHDLESNTEILLGQTEPLRFPTSVQVTTAKPVIKSHFAAPSAAVVNQWVARTPKTPSQDSVSSPAMSVADTIQP